MDYSTYEIYDFDRISAFNMSTGYKERSYHLHWHSYGEILIVGPGEKNIYQVGKNTYELAENDLVLVWPMEMHAILDANREKSMVIQFSNAFINSLVDIYLLRLLYLNLNKRYFKVNTCLCTSSSDDTACSVTYCSALRYDRRAISLL